MENTNNTTPVTDDVELQEAAYNYANKKKLEIGGIDVWAFVEIFTDGAKYRESHPIQALSGIEAKAAMEWVADNHWQRTKDGKWYDKYSQVRSEITTEHLHSTFKKG